MNTFIRTALLFILALAIQARAAGLAGEYLITQRWRDLLSPYSPLTNPAVLTEENYFSVRAAFAPTLGASFRLWEMGATLPLGLYQSAGFSWVGLSSGEFEASAWTGAVSDDPETGVTTTGMLAFQSHFFMLSYAVNPVSALSVGANVNIAYQKFWDEEQRVNRRPGLDIGATYRLLNHPVLGRHIAGACLQNLIAPQFKKAQSGSMEEQYSRNLKLWWLWSAWENRIQNSIDFDIKDMLSDEKLFTGEPFLEYNFHYRLTVQLLGMLKVCGQIGRASNSAPYVGMAGGINIPTLNAGRDLEVLYQYNNMLQREIISTHTFYARTQFGKHREAAYARRIARTLHALPNHLYNRALTLFSQGNYWDAFFVFGQILSQFPDFFKNDWVSYYMHRCQEQLDMRSAAAKGYARMQKTFPHSAAVPYAELGIMRTAYRQGDNMRALDCFSKLYRPGIPDSLKYEAYYLVGQTHMRMEEWGKAIQALSAVPENHSLYVFAQHSAGIALLMDGDTLRALTAFEEAITAGGAQKAHKEIASRSLLMAGYVFYQQGRLPKAVWALRKIPENSFYYDDALLGLGWAALKGQQWEDCMAAGAALARAGGKELLQCEGLLLRGYALLLQKDYEAAHKELKRADERITQIKAMSPDSLKKKEKIHENQRAHYESIAGSAYDLSVMRKRERAAGSIDSLHAQQTMIKKALDSYQRMSDRIQRERFFQRPVETVREDIDYAYATAARMTESKRVEEEIAKEIKKQEKIELEIEKTKQKIEEIEKGE